MNRFTVLWSPAAEAELARLWTESSDRQSITVATAQIDRELRTDPETKGEDVLEGVRVLYVPPLRVCFEVVPQDCKVWVTLVSELSL